MSIFTPKRVLIERINEAEARFNKLNRAFCKSRDENTLLTNENEKARQEIIELVQAKTEAEKSLDAALIRAGKLEAQLKKAAAMNEKLARELHRTETKYSGLSRDILKTMTADRCHICSHNGCENCCSGSEWIWRGEV